MRTDQLSSIMKKSKVNQVHSINKVQDNDNNNDENNDDDNVAETKPCLLHLGCDPDNQKSYAYCSYNNQ